MNKRSVDRGAMGQTVAGHDHTLVTEAELNAFVDHQLPVAAHKQVEQLLIVDEAMRARVDMLRRLKQMVRMAALFPPIKNK